jgi:hypothetical protein
MRSPNFFDLPDAQVYSASNRDEYQKAFLGGKVWLAHKADNLIALYEPIV